jgi:hypothetical protein
MKMLPKPWSGEMKGLPKPWPFDEPTTAAESRWVAAADTATQILGVDGRQIISDAYLRFALRIVSQQRRIEELKRLCGVK